MLRNLILLIVFFLGPFAISAPTLATPESSNPAESSPVEIIYGISPYYFVKGFDQAPLKEIRRRIPEIKELGATILWLQPVMKSADPGQGYDTVDHFQVDPRYGTAKDLRDLVKAAHKSGMKVILDIAINHTSIQHPFAQDLIQKGSQSEHFNFYQWQIKPRLPYSKHAKIRKEGKATFVTYFWDNLVNLDYSKQPARDYALRVLEFWVREFDVDGFRFDASWGPQTRWPAFYRTVSSSLQKIKPNLFLLAEDKAGFPALYENTTNPHLKDSGFQAAYDWDSSDPEWVSRWAFQDVDNHEKTIFEMEEAKWAAREYVRIVKKETSRQQIAPVRYLQNNDTQSFLHSHSRRQTKFAAASLFLLPGIPMLFYGQEMGMNYPEWHLPSIDPGQDLKDFDPVLWNFYRDLIALKKSSKVLSQGQIQRIRVVQETQTEMILEHQGQTQTVLLDWARLTFKVSSPERSIPRGRP